MLALLLVSTARPDETDVMPVQLVPAVTELIIAELLYLQYKDRSKPMFLYINSTGTTRADGETVRPVPFFTDSHHCLNTS